jgi:hypothetical protein
MTAMELEVTPHPDHNAKTRESAQFTNLPIEIFFEVSIIL